MIDKEKLTPSQRQLRTNVRNFLMIASHDQLIRELESSIELGDEFRAMCVRELINES